CRPVLHRTLTLTHTDFGRLLGNGKIRENADPDAALTLHFAGDRTAGSLDLASRDALRLGGLEGVLAESQGGTALGLAVNAALVSLAELGSLRLQHNELTFLCAFAIAAFTARFALGALTALTA